MIEPFCCPNPDCHFHWPDDEFSFPRFWSLQGTYHTAVSGTVQRFKCSYCGCGFSERTLSIDYYAKKSLDYMEINRAISASESVASIARKQKCHPDSISNRLDRIGRNVIAAHARLIEELLLSENIVADGFESFDRSQFHPNNINLAVGEESQFLYGFTHCTLRRKGRMTDEQKAKREEIEADYKPPRRAVIRSFKKLINNIMPLWREHFLPKLRLITDEHKSYITALKEIERIQEALERGVFTHERHSSKLPRTVRNPLFPVNYWDRELRKDIAAFHRESTCYTRNVSNGLMRLVVYQFRHNYFKPHRVKNTYFDRITHAIVAGFDVSKIEREKKKLFTQRAFLSHQMLNDEERMIWLKEHKTPRKEGPNWVPQFAKVA